jgi:hypothetical protein
MKIQNSLSSLSSKLKENLREMYTDSLIPCLLGKASDVFTTFLGSKRYPIEAEIGPLTKIILFNFSPEAGSIVLYGTSLLAIPSFYAISKGMEKAISLVTSEALLKWRDFYKSFIYGFTFASLAASINNIFLLFGYPFSHKEIFVLVPYISMGGMLSLKIWKRTKKLYSPSIPSS